MRLRPSPLFGLRGEGGGYSRPFWGGFVGGYSREEGDSRVPFLGFVGGYSREEGDSRGGGFRGGLLPRGGRLPR